MLGIYLRNTNYKLNEIYRGKNIDISNYAFSL